MSSGIVNPHNFNTTHKCTFTVGILIRKILRRNIKKIAFELDLSLDLQEEKGFLESTFFICVKGSSESVSKFITWCKFIVE